MEEPRFNPSVNTQRHQYVIDFVKTHKPKKVSNTGDPVAITLASNVPLLINIYQFNTIVTDLP